MWIVWLGIGLYTVWQLVKWVKEEIKKRTSSVFVRFDISSYADDFITHPFFKGKIIPFLMENGFSKAKVQSGIKAIEKEYEGTHKKISFEEIYWARTFSGLITSALSENGGSGSLYFGSFNCGDLDNCYQWNGAYRILHRGRWADPFEFVYEICKKDDSIIGRSSILLKGKWVRDMNSKEARRVFKVYLYVQGEKMRDYNKDDLENVWILGEIPYELIAWYRYDYANKKQKDFQALLQKYNLELEKRDDGDVFMDELGEHQLVGDWPGFTVKSKYLETRIS